MVGGRWGDGFLLSLFLSFFLLLLPLFLFLFPSLGFCLVLITISWARGMCTAKSPRCWTPWFKSSVIVIIIIIIIINPLHDPRRNLHHSVPILRFLLRPHPAATPALALQLLLVPLQAPDEGALHAYLVSVTVEDDGDGDDGDLDEAQEGSGPVGVEFRVHLRFKVRVSIDSLWAPRFKAVR